MFQYIVSKSISVLSFAQPILDQHLGLTPYNYNKSPYDVILLNIPSSSLPPWIHNLPLQSIDVIFNS